MLAFRPTREERRDDRPGNQAGCVVGGGGGPEGARSWLPGAGGPDETGRGTKAIPGKGGSKTRAAARGKQKSYRSSQLEIRRVGSVLRRINQMDKGSQANRRKGEELSTTVRGCTRCRAIGLYSGRDSAPGGSAS